MNKPVKYKTFPLFYNEYNNKYHYVPSLISYVSIMYITIQKFGVSKKVFWNKLVLVFITNALNWSKVTVKPFELSIHLWILKE